MELALRRVHERFQHVRERVTRVFERDADFRDLCEEYVTCAEVLARLESSGPSAQAMRNEYAVLLLRLERELIRYLGEHPDREDG
jgi:hypothetical protein